MAAVSLRLEEVSPHASAVAPGGIGCEAVESFEGARLDAEKLGVLRQWGAGLSDDPREEVRAAGKAITMLVEEIDRLYVELWHARDTRAAAEESADVEDVETTLRGRIRSRVSPSRGRGGHPPT